MSAPFFPNVCVIFHQDLDPFFRRLDPDQSNIDPDPQHCFIHRKNASEENHCSQRPWELFSIISKFLATKKILRQKNWKY